MACDTNSSDGFNASSAFEYNRKYQIEYNAEIREPFIPLMMVTGIESVIGIIGNSLVFYVFSRRYRKCNFKLFVLFLSGTDLAACITSMPLDIVMRYYYFDVPGPIFCKINYFFLLSILLAETFLLFVICIDRYRKICHPFSWQISNRNALRLIMLALFIAAIASGLVTGIVFGSQDEEVTYRNMKIIVKRCGPDQKYKDNPLSGIIVIVQFTIIVGILLVMIVLYILVARQLYNTRTAFDSKTKTDKSQSTFSNANMAPARHKSIIAITLTVVFVVTLTLFTVFAFLLASQKLKDLSKDELTVYTFLSTTYRVNYCINPFIYGCLDHQISKFLRELKTRVCGSMTDYPQDATDKVGSARSQTGIEEHTA